ncbi:MAG: S24 family peptidase [Thiohalomonadaceae bacterium]
MSLEKFIPIARADELERDPMAAACQAKEPYVLMVLGDSMEPEFMEGEVIVIDPEGVARDGSFVIAWHNEEYIFRQLKIIDEQWHIAALNTAYPMQKLSGPDAVKGVIIQKKTPGRRGARKSYA